MMGIGERQRSPQRATMRPRAFEKAEGKEEEKGKGKRHSCDAGTLESTTAMGKSKHGRRTCLGGTRLLHIL